VEDGADKTPHDLTPSRQARAGLEEQQRGQQPGQEDKTCALHRMLLEVPRHGTPALGGQGQRAGLPGRIAAKHTSIGGGREPEAHRLACLAPGLVLHGRLEQEGAAEQHPLTHLQKVHHEV
jgi:hypothetical protein